MPQQEDALHGGDMLKGEGWEANHRQPLFGPGMDLKLHPGVRSSRNSMKVLTARTDVSYLRYYKTGGVCGAFFVSSGSFCFSATLPLLYHQCIAFVFLLGVGGACINNFTLFSPFPFFFLSFEQ